jgi:hypothetical protein
MLDFICSQNLILKGFGKLKKKEEKKKAGLGLVAKLAVRPKLASSAHTPSLSLLSLADGWGPHVSALSFFLPAVLEQETFPRRIGSADPAISLPSAQSDHYKASSIAPSTCFRI